VRPALKRADVTAKVFQPESVVQRPNRIESIEQQAVKAITKSALMDSPILSRVEWLWNEARTAVDETKRRKGRDGAEIPADLKARAQLLAVANQAINTFGKASMHPGFAPAEPAAPTNVNLMVVLPRPNDGKPEPTTIDIRAEVSD
jgi:hypothetical protein